MTAQVSPVALEVRMEVAVVKSQCRNWYFRIQQTCQTYQGVVLWEEGVLHSHCHPHPDQEHRILRKLEPALHLVVVQIQIG